MKCFIRFAISALLSVALIVGHPILAADETPVVIQVKLLIDGSGGPALDDAEIVIQGKRIAAVGKRGTLALPKGAKIFNFRYKVAMPGMIDAHSHYREWQGEIYLSHGVTTAFDIGESPLAWRFAQKEGIDKGKIVGPRLLVAGRLNKAAGADSGEEGSTRGGAETYVRNAEEARAEAKKALAAGVNMIKALEFFSTEDLRTIAEEAHAAGRPIITHSINGTEAVLAGVDINSIEHSHSVAMATVGSAEGRKKLHEARTSTRNRMSTQEVHSFMEEDSYDRVIQALVAKNVCWTPTLSTTWRAFSPNRTRFEKDELRLLSLPALAYIPPYFRANTKEYFFGTANLEPALKDRVDTGYRKLQEFLRRFVKAGGRLQTGSDPNSILPGMAIQREVEILVEAGLTPAEALTAATKNPADCEGRTADFGTITPGRFADVVILDGNPLEDIFAVERVHTVFKEGVERKPGYHANYRNPIPRPDPDRPAPEVEKIAPDSVLQGEGPLALSIKGKNFLSTAVVKVNGKPVQSEVQFRPVRFPQNFRRSSEISATVPAELLTKPGTYTVVVEHPGVGGATSDPAYLIVKFR